MRDQPLSLVLIILSNYAVTSYGAFFQDHWTLLPRLTLDIGVRYDFEHFALRV
jgi:outer membrane receptor protein involved in Fe transport